MEQEQSPENQINHLLDIYPNINNYIRAYIDEVREKSATSVKRPIKKTLVLGRDLRYVFREYKMGDSLKFLLNISREWRGPKNLEETKSPLTLDWMADTEEKFTDASVIIHDDGVTLFGTTASENESQELKIHNNPHVAKDIEYIVRDVIFHGYDLSGRQRP